MDTTLTVQGNLVADPTQRMVANGAIRVTFRVASSSRRFDRPSGEYRDGDTLYIGVTCWRSLGVNVMASLRKGDSVVVHGKLQYRTYDDRQGVRRTAYDIDATAVGPDLVRCPADLRRPPRRNEPLDTAGPGSALGREVEAVAAPEPAEVRSVAA